MWGARSAGGGSTKRPRGIPLHRRDSSKSEKDDREAQNLILRETGMYKFFSILFSPDELSPDLCCQILQESLCSIDYVVSDLILVSGSREKIHPLLASPLRSTPREQQLIAYQLDTLRTAQSYWIPATVGSNSTRNGVQTVVNRDFNIYNRRVARHRLTTRKTLDDETVMRQLSTYRQVRSISYCVPVLSILLCSLADSCYNWLHEQSIQLVSYSSSQLQLLGVVDANFTYSTCCRLL